MNETHDIVIIGCGAGGGTAAQFARKTDRKAQITCYEQGPYPQYSKCGLPYSISGDIPSPHDLIEFSQEWFDKARIDLHLESKVLKIDPKKHEIVVETKKGTQINKSYTELIIATGATPAVPPIKHVLKHDRFVKGVHTLRSIDDAEHIIQEIASKPQHATIIGAGFIGLEMADCLHRKGLDVTVIEALPFILFNVLDEDFSTWIAEKISSTISLYTSHLAVEIQVEDDHVTEVLIQHVGSKDTKRIPTDLLIIATGTRPETHLASQAGCKLGETGGILVDNQARTSQNTIYAVGDCTEFTNFVTKTPILVGLGSIAVRQAIAAGVNAAGGKYYLPDGALQTCTSEFFGTEIAAVGPCSRLLENDDIIIGKHAGSSLPEYFPGGIPISVKTKISSTDGTILAAQAVGANAAQRVNTYATAILGKLSTDTFRAMETAYAPPIAPTLDVVSIAADVAAMKYQRKKK